jgi:hypothetical protein
MGDRALLAVPLLEELLHDPDPEVSRRAQLGIDAATEAADLERDNCPPGESGGATEQDVAAAEARS